MEEEVVEKNIRHRPIMPRRPYRRFVGSTLNWKIICVLYLLGRGCHVHHVISCGTHIYLIYGAHFLMKLWYLCIMLAVPCHLFAYYRLTLSPGHLLKVRFQVMPIMILFQFMPYERDWHSIIHHHIHHQMQHC